MISACLNIITLATILAGLFFVKSWIKFALEGERRWRFTAEGNFLLYFILLLLLTIEQAAVSVWVSQADQASFS